MRVQSLLSGQENRWLRQVVGVQKSPSDEWVPFLRRAKQLVHQERRLLQIPALWHRALAAVHGWGGHVSRRGAGHPTHAVLSWRCAAWWQDLQIWGPALGLSDWRHPRTNWKSTFEQALVDFHGVAWWITATESRVHWRQRAREFVLRGVSRWGGPSGVPRKLRVMFAP